MKNLENECTTREEEEDHRYFVLVHELLGRDKKNYIIHPICENGFCYTFSRLNGGGTCRLQWATWLTNGVHLLDSSLGKNGPVIKYTKERISRLDACPTLFYWRTEREIDEDINQYSGKSRSLQIFPYLWKFYCDRLVFLLNRCTQGVSRKQVSLIRQASMNPVNMAEK